MSERKVSMCQAAVASSGQPSLGVWTVGDHEEIPNYKPAVMMWRTDYDALLAEIAEYKALIKVCERCKKKECAEFVYPGKDGLEYCQTCYDDMFPREWLK